MVRPALEKYKHKARRARTRAITRTARARIITTLGATTRKPESAAIARRRATGLRNARRRPETKGKTQLAE